MKSMFLPYKDKVQELLDLGYRATEILEFFGEGYSYAALTAFIRNHEMRENPKRVPPKCDNCEYMHHFEGRLYQDCRICTRSWKLIENNVMFAPRWCEERKVI